MDFICNYRDINVKRDLLVSFENMPDLISVDCLRKLHEFNIDPIKLNKPTSFQVTYINQLIQENIEKVKEIIPSWVKWEYIKNLIIMPGCNSGKNDENLKSDSSSKKALAKVHSTCKLFFSSKEFYPYGTYMNWPLNKMKNYYGNILLNDAKFLKLLYSSQGETFSATEYVIDALESDKRTIYQFIDAANNICVLVDCENVDPYRFMSVFKNLESDEIRKIKKIVLYDDVNTSNAWDLICKHIDIPVEHKEVERILDNKSLVDHAMTAGAFKEYYTEQTESLILASSDSDFWGLISNLEEARFYVLNESEKTSPIILNKLDEKGINHCFMDDFAQGAVQSFKTIVLKKNLQKKIDEFNGTGCLFTLSLSELMNKLFEESAIKGEARQIAIEKEDFFKKYLKKGLKLKPYQDGEDYYFELELD